MTETEIQEMYDLGKPKDSTNKDTTRIWIKKRLSRTEEQTLQNFRMSLATWSEEELESMYRGVESRIKSVSSKDRKEFWRRINLKINLELKCRKDEMLC